MNDEIHLSFEHLTILFTIGAVYSASLAIVTSAVVKTLGWTRPYTHRRELILQWAPALLSAGMGFIFAPLVYSMVVTQVQGWPWHAAGIPVGFMSGLVSKPAYYLLKRRLAPAWIDASEYNIKNGA